MKIPLLDGAEREWERKEEVQSDIAMDVDRGKPLKPIMQPIYHKYLPPRDLIKGKQNIRINYLAPSRQSINSSFSPFILLLYFFSVNEV